MILPKIISPRRAVRRVKFSLCALSKVVVKKGTNWEAEEEMKKKCFRRTRKIHKLILAREPIYRHWHQKFIRLWVSLFVLWMIWAESAWRVSKSGGIDLERIIICVRLRAKMWKQLESIKCPVSKISFLNHFFVDFCSTMSFIVGLTQFYLSNKSFLIKNCRTR